MEKRKWCGERTQEDWKSRSEQSPRVAGVAVVVALAGRGVAVNDRQTDGTGQRARPGQAMSWPTHIHTPLFPRDL